MVLLQIKDTDTQLNLGEQVEPLLEFQESVVQVLIDLVKPLSVICVEKVECLLHYKFGEDGIEKLILNKKDMPFLLLLPLQLSYH